jgi:hypothetical protein
LSHVGGWYTTGNQGNSYLPKRMQDPKEIKNSKYKYNICTKPPNYFTVTAKKPAFRLSGLTADTDSKMRSPVRKL